MQNTLKSNKQNITRKKIYLQTKEFSLKKFTSQRKTHNRAYQVSYVNNNKSTTYPICGMQLMHA